MALIGYIEQLYCVGLNNRFLRQIVSRSKTTMSTMEEEDNFSRSSRNAVHHALSSKFENVRQLKPVQEEALLQFIRRKDVFCVLPTGCGKSLIFQLVPLVCAYLHNEKFNYPEKPILLVICPLSALVESHIQELANYGILSCYLGHDGLIEEEISQHSSIFSMSLLHFKQRWEERPFSLVTSNPSTCDNRPATLFCKDVFPSNRWKRAQPEIAILTLQTRQKSPTDVRKILTGVRENVVKTAIETMFSRNYIFTHRCATCNQMSAVRFNMFNENKHADHPTGPKTGLMRYLIRKLHGNEVAYSCDQRLFFSPRRLFLR